MTTLKRKIHLTTLFFMAALLLSGVSAIPARQGVSWLLEIAPANGMVYEFLSRVKLSLWQTPDVVFYAFDWLAFAHFVIALLFIGVLREPVRNIWIVQWAMLACVLIWPLAIIMGSFRGIPWWWMLIDSSFGIFGLLPLFLLKKWIAQLEITTAQERLNIIF
ncbi:MAG: hypothetical protein U0T73_13100 [Chitinophagales bacterium]